MRRTRAAQKVAQNQMNLRPPCGVRRPRGATEIGDQSYKPCRGERVGRGAVLPVAAAQSGPGVTRTPVGLFGHRSDQGARHELLPR